MEEEIKYLSREECIEKLVNECRFYKVGDVFNISKISSQMVTHKSRILLWESIKLFTIDYKGNSITERLYWFFYRIDNYPSCKICSTSTNFQGFNLGYTQFCSQKCVGVGSNEKRDKTKKEKYPNGEGIKHNPQKAKQTKLERYGNENYTNSKKAKETCLNRYGVDNPAKIDFVKESKRATCLKRYNAENPFQSSKIQEKIKNDRFNKTGYINVSQLPEVKEKKRVKNSNKSEEEKQQKSIKLKKAWKNKTKEQIKIQFEKSSITYFNKTGYKHQSQDPNSKIHINSVKSIFHPNYKNIYYQSNNEKIFLDIIDELNLNSYICRGVSIKYKYGESFKYYIADFILEYNKNNKYLIEIKATHNYFYTDLWNGILFSKWDASEKFCKENNYREYIFILNNKIIKKEEIINNIMIPFFHLNYPYL